MVAGVGFLAATMRATVRAQTPPWKSSALAVMSCEVCALEHARSVAEMERRARGQRLMFSFEGLDDAGEQRVDGDGGGGAGSYNGDAGGSAADGVLVADTEAAGAPGGNSRGGELHGL